MSHEDTLSLVAHAAVHKIPSHLAIRQAPADLSTGDRKGSSLGHILLLDWEPGRTKRVDRAMQHANYVYFILLDTP